MRGRRGRARRISGGEEAKATSGGSFSGGSAKRAGTASSHGIQAARPAFGLGGTVERKPLGSTVQRQDLEVDEAASEALREDESLETEEADSVQRQVDDLEEEEQSAPARKKAEGGESTPGSAPADMSALKGRGQTLPGSSQAFFGSRFGHDFSHVRIHTDDRAEDMARSLDARAFTTGNHVAFGRNEYRPGTLEGDTLIAHELAHVVQQRSAPALQEGASSEVALEEDADRSAAGAVAARWSGATDASSTIARMVRPRMRSGLRLQRCSKYSKEEQKKIDDTKRILEGSTTGKQALEIQKKYKVSFKFSPAGTGSYYDSSSNEMRMDAGHSPERAALSFVHEMNHAKYHHEGLQADPKKETRDEYVRKMVVEEAEGVVKSIEAKAELEGSVDFSGVPGYPPLESKYKQARDDAITAAKAADPKKSEAELAAIGRKAGRRRVVKGFMDGDIKTSTTGETYPDYYGKAWDRINKSK